MSFEIKFYKTTRGDESVKDYLLSLSNKESAALSACITNLKKIGMLSLPHGKKLDKDLYEIRYKKHRILYCIKEGWIILLHAFQKQTQKTPKRDLDLAIKRKKQL